MGEFRGFDLDSETSRAWAAFATTLGGRLSSLGADETLSIGLGRSSDQVSLDTPALVFSATPGGQFRRTEHAADNAVTGLEISDGSDLDGLCHDSVRLLRDVHGVMHPAFLSVTSDLDGREAEFSVQAGSDAASIDRSPVPQVVVPADSDHLRALVRLAVTRDLGHEPDQDVDGDLIVETGGVRLFVRVLDRAPVISVFGRLVHDIVDAECAPAVVASLNQEYPHVKFLFADRAVIAGVHLPAIPFVPAQLRNLLVTFAQLAGEIDDDLAARLGGTREIEEDEADQPLELRGQAQVEPDGVPPELLTLVRLDPEGQGLDAEQTAEVCSYDRALARQLLHIAIGQEEVWQAAAHGTDDPEQESRCAEEAAGWHATKRSLTGALELIDALER